MKNTGIRYISVAAVVAALYAALTFAFWQFSSMAIQVRVSEALCVLTAFTGAAVPGLFLGCLLANLLSGTVLDVIAGSLSTLLAAFIGRLLFKKVKTRALKLILLPLPTVLINALVVPVILIYGYGVQASGALFGYPVLCLSVLLGQTIACYGLGIPLFLLLERIDRRHGFFRLSY